MVRVSPTSRRSASGSGAVVRAGISSRSVAVRYAVSRCWLGCAAASQLANRGASVSMTEAGTGANSVMPSPLSAGMLRPDRARNSGRRLLPPGGVPHVFEQPLEAQAVTGTDALAHADHVSELVDFTA